MESLERAIYDASSLCRRSLAECIEIEELMRNEWAENRLADFNLWASGIGASVHGKASLDARLASRPDARDAVANLLQVMNSAVEECKAAAQSGSVDNVDSAGDGDDINNGSDSEDPPRSFSPWSEDSDSDSETEIKSDTDPTSTPLSKAKQNVESILELLVRVAITIRRSGNQSRLRKADRKFKIDDHVEFQKYLVAIMLSQVALNQLQSEAETSFFVRTAALKGFGHTAAGSSTPSSTSARRNLTRRSPASCATLARAATSHKTSTKAISRFRGYGDKCFWHHRFANPPANFTEWTSVLSRRRNPIIYHSHQTTISASSSDKTRCFGGELSLLLSNYSSCTDVWMCFACLECLQFERVDDFVAHTRQEHPDTISEDQVHALAVACRKSITTEITSCPICAWPIEEEPEVSPEALLDHIAEHIHTFSLQALPWGPNTVYETQTQIQKAAIKVEHWLTENNLTSETSTTITYLGPTISPPSQTDYFDTHEYFAEGPDDDSEATISDGTIERALRDEAHPLFQDFEEDEVAHRPTSPISSTYSAASRHLESSTYSTRQDHDHMTPQKSGKDAETKPKGYLPKSNYKFGGTIAATKRSITRRAEFLHSSSASLVAVKTVMKINVKDKDDEIHGEVGMLQELNHPNIVKFRDWFESKDKFYIVTELADGGELSDRLTERGRYTEPEARRAIMSILDIVKYLHHRGIVHGHLGLRKFVYFNRGPDSDLALVSLAHASWPGIEGSVRLSANHPLPYSGRDSHVFAPEMLRNRLYGKSADMWSIGVMLYTLLVGYSPFRSENIVDLIEECTQGQIVFHERYWGRIRSEAKNFIAALLTPEHRLRLTAEIKMRHPQSAARHQD
ncbi:calcium calmodulin-dependent kinase [Fusarium longipes]|uniref:Calcium calmodulin-dependent kinase n=1 Tax=Fusarium longipes TaxID=694270 RepID=A0A395T3R6_9HYPO|nr:calcium calmodulin-dependent kinase [Fusarium longipes]